MRRPDGAMNGDVRFDRYDDLGMAELSLATAAYLGAALWWLSPLPAHLSTHAAFALHGAALEFRGADWYLIAWALAWGSHAFTTDPLHAFDANAFHPAPSSLAFSEHFFGQQPFFAPLYLATGNVVLAMNGLLLAGFTLSAVGFYALARRFVAPPAAFAAGLLFSFAPFRHESLFHLHLVGVQYLPLAVFFTERWYERGNRLDAYGLATALTLQALSSVYLAFALGLLYGPYLLVATWRWRVRIDRRRLLGVLAAAGVASAVVAAASVPYVRLGRLGLIPSYGLDAYAPALGASFAHLRVQRYLAASGVGWSGYALVLLAFAPPWRGRRWAMAIAVVAAATGLLVASGYRGLEVGPVHVPALFPWLIRIASPLAAIRMPSRVVIVAHLGLSLLVALGLQRATGWMPRWIAWATAALAASVFLSGRVEGTQLHAVPSCRDAPPAIRWLAAHGAGRPVLELPYPRADVAARRMYLSTCHWLPVVGGYSAYPIRVADLIYATARGLPSEGALQAVVDLVDVGWIVVHGDELPPSDLARWHAPLPAGLEEVARFGATRILRVTRAPGIGNRRARLFSATETIDGTPLTPLGPRCPGRLELVGPPPSLRIDADLRVLVRVTNTSDVPWPGFGFIPRHLLHVRTCVTFGDVPCHSEPAPLGVDVPAGATRLVPVRVKAPRGPGERTLRIELWQLGDGPLDACGVAPLIVPVRVNA